MLGNRIIWIKCQYNIFAFIMLPRNRVNNNEWIIWMNGHSHGMGNTICLKAFLQFLSSVRMQHIQLWEHRKWYILCYKHLPQACLLVYSVTVWVPSLWRTQAKTHRHGSISQLCKSYLVLGRKHNQRKACIRGCNVAWRCRAYEIVLWAMIRAGFNVPWLRK